MELTDQSIHRYHFETEVTHDPANNANTNGAANSQPWN
jgi:hypothetical protein